MNNVVQLHPVEPKKVKRTYRQQHYIVTYNMQTKTWHWAVEVVSTTRYDGDCESQVKAFRAAERCIDRVKKLQGVG